MDNAAQALGTHAYVRSETTDEERRTSALYIARNLKATENADELLEAARKIAAFMKGE